MPEPAAVDVDPEDAKLITLARATRARLGAVEGAAVRDDTGRTYTGAPVALPSLSLTGLQVAVATALSSGAHSLEAAAVVGDSGELPEADVRLLADLGAPPVLLAGPDGTIRERG